MGLEQQGHVALGPDPGGASARVDPCFARRALASGFPAACLRSRWLALCFLRLEELWQKGLTALSVAQKDPYYRRLLAADSPGTVPYAEPEPSAPQRDTLSFARVSLALSRRLRATSHVNKRHLQQEPAPESPEHTATAAGVATKRRRRDLVADLLSLLPVAEDVPGPLAERVPEPFAEVPRVESQWVMPTGATPVPTEESPNLLGARVQVDTRLATESRSAHKRWLILCPFKKDRHSHAASGSGSSFCCKSRAIGPRTTSRFGELEPWAFWGCWIEAAER